MQIDFGTLTVKIGNEPWRVHFFAAVLGYSRRQYVQAFLHERQSAWFEGIEGAFRHFDGVPEQVLLDNARLCWVQMPSTCAPIHLTHTSLAKFDPKKWETVQKVFPKVQSLTYSGKIKHSLPSTIVNRLFDAAYNVAILPVDLLEGRRQSRRDSWIDEDGLKWSPPLRVITQTMYNIYRKIRKPCQHDHYLAQTTRSTTA